VATSTGAWWARGLGGYFVRQLSLRQLRRGRTGRGQKPPPQLGQTSCRTCATQAAQKVHSKEQIIASGLCGGSGRLQFSQDGRSCNMRMIVRGPALRHKDMDATPSAIAFSVLPGTWAVVRLAPGDAIPPWALAAPGLVSFTRTADELSVVCAQAAVPPGCRAEPGWALLAIRGPLPFDQVGVLAAVSTPLAAAGVSLFAVSTFDTDYLLVKTDRLDTACQALRSAGHVQVGP
jgi:hypothetical protein